MERQGIAGPAIAVVGLLVLVWPLVRTPPLELDEAFAHVFAWWGALVVALAIRARLARRATSAAPGDDEA